jgi:sugar lactone lactonase YvrE
MRVGQGKYSYELVEGWLKIPEGWTFPDVPSVTIDSKDRVYIFSRGTTHPIGIFDSNSKLLTWWGGGHFDNAHAGCIGPDGNHTVTKFSPEGKLLMTLGTKGKPSNTGFANRSGGMRDGLAAILGGPPFNRPTGVALLSNGNIYVSDGYGNCKVHVFSPDGKLLFSWGEPGTGPGQFMLCHSIWIDRQDRVWIGDRENSRIQIFTPEGKFITEWRDVWRPTAVWIDKEDTVYVSELDRRVSIFTIDGKLLTRWDSPGADDETALLVAPHGIAVDSKGDIYVCEVCHSHNKYEKRGNKIVQKFARIH